MKVISIVLKSNGHQLIYLFCSGNKWHNNLFFIIIRYIYIYIYIYMYMYMYMKHII
jgi:hypothetical protein